VVYDRLFGVDSNYKPHPQMADTYSASEDGKSYEFALRPDLKFHGGAPVTSADAIGSIQRWAKGDPAGLKMVAAGMQLEKVDDRTFKMTFEKPFGQAIDMMAKPRWPLFVYPERDTSNETSGLSSTLEGSRGSRHVQHSGAVVVSKLNGRHGEALSPALIHAALPNRIL
jgi:ABC-type transport system substrate-binding protein